MKKRTIVIIAIGIILSMGFFMAGILILGEFPEPVFNKGFLMETISFGIMLLTVGLALVVDYH